MKNKTKTFSILRKSFALIAAVILVLSVFGLSGCQEKGTPADNGTSSAASETQDIKNVNFKIVYEDGTSKTIELKTEKSTLAEALVDAKVIEYSNDGFYTTIDGVTADYSKDGSWWCITKGGEMTSVGINDIVISDGETYEATYTK